MSEKKTRSYHKRRGRGRGGYKRNYAEFSKENFSRPVKHATPQSTETKGDVKDEWNFFGYVGLFGPRIEESAKKDVDQVPQEYIEKKNIRDRGKSHITLMLKQDIKEALRGANLIPEYKKIIEESKERHKGGSDIHVLMDLVSQVIVDDWEDLGLGRVKKDDNETYFKVLKWKSAQEFLKNVGLKEKDFHITVGFKVADIHNVPKNETTLIQKE